MAQLMTPSPQPNLTLSASTLDEILRLRAQEQPDRLAYIFLEDGETESGRLTYAELDQKARVIAAELRSDATPSTSSGGERTLLLYPPGLEYIAAFFGCLYAGVIPVPAYPPRLNRPEPRLQT